LPNQARVSHLDPTKSINTLDEKKGIGGDYLKERVGNELHGQICRNPPRFEGDFGRGEVGCMVGGEQLEEETEQNK
jgi:hypothetical protein